MGEVPLQGHTRRQDYEASTADALKPRKYTGVCSVQRTSGVDVGGSGRAILAGDFWVSCLLRSGL